MKLVLCVLACLCFLAQAALLPPHVADKTYLTKQKSIYELFWHVDQPTVYHPELHQKARTFSIVENIENYSDKEAVTEFLDLLKHGMLPRGQVFTIMDPEIQSQAVVLFRVLFSAKTFETFYNTAVWARFHVNEQMFVYSLSVAVFHRPDTRNIKLPPLYEVVPHFYFNEEVMLKAYKIAMGDLGTTKKTMGGTDYYVVPANYSGWYLTRPNVPEQKLTYYTEDIGLNAFYFTLNHNYPTFMDTATYHLPNYTRGEFYFFAHKQMLVRYYLERLSNGLGEIQEVSVDRPIPTGYYPTMHYQNGLPFPQRETNAMIPLEMQENVQMLKDLHSRISNAIDRGVVLDNLGNPIKIYTEGGLNILGNIVQGNADTVNERFYGNLDTLMRKVFGFGFESNVKYQSVPSALEIWSTSLRDPVFYSIYKNILTYYHRYKENLPMYTQAELLFPGVKIESVNVDKLTTYFDYFVSMLNNGVSIRSHKEAQDMVIKARQYRLNHKPFTYHILVNSDKATQAMVRIYLGPKYDVNGHELDLENNYMNFMEMDEWIADLKVGSNKIERSSHESVYVVKDETPSDIMYKKLMTSMEGTTLSIEPYAYPDRLILPRGRKEGMPFKLFVVISSLDDSKVTETNHPTLGLIRHDTRSMGYPLDRPMDQSHFFVPNMYLKDVTIYHKEMEELNIPA